MLKVQKIHLRISKGSKDKIACGVDDSKRWQSTQLTSTKKIEAVSCGRCIDIAEQLIHRATNLNLCDADCGCGENNGLWWYPVCGDDPPAWVPDWMNGADTHEVWQWLAKNAPPDALTPPAWQARGSGAGGKQKKRTPVSTPAAR